MFEGLVAFMKLPLEQQERGLWEIGQWVFVVYIGFFVGRLIANSCEDYPHPWVAAFERFLRFLFKWGERTGRFTVTLMLAWPFLSVLNQLLFMETSLSEEVFAHAFVFWMLALGVFLVFTLFVERKKDDKEEGENKNPPPPDDDYFF